MLKPSRNDNTEVDVEDKEDGDKVADNSNDQGFTPMTLRLAAASPVSVTVQSPPSDTTVLVSTTMHFSFPWPQRHAATTLDDSSRILMKNFTCRCHVLVSFFIFLPLSFYAF